MESAICLLTKSAIERLDKTFVIFWQVGEKLGKYEAEKKKAVELEDFDLAMEKKVCITFFFLDAFYCFYHIL